MYATCPCLLLLLLELIILIMFDEGYKYKTCPNAVLMYVPCILYSLLSRPTNEQHILKKKKGKAVLLQAWSGPEGSRKLRFPDFMTTAQDGGKVVSLTHW